MFYQAVNTNQYRERYPFRFRNCNLWTDRLDSVAGGQFLNLPSLLNFIFPRGNFSCVVIFCGENLPKEDFPCGVIGNRRNFQSGILRMVECSLNSFEYSCPGKLKRIHSLMFLHLETCQNCVRKADSFCRIASSQA